MDNIKATLSKGDEEFSIFLNNPSVHEMKVFIEQVVSSLKMANQKKPFHFKIPLEGELIEVESSEDTSTNSP
jgi:hypothetical protein